MARNRNQRTRLYFDSDFDQEKPISKIKKGDKPHTSFRIDIPTSLYFELREKSRLIGLPMARLLEIAIDNELECTPPFNYEIHWPTEPYKEFEHAVNAKKITDFLVRFRDGLGLEMLLLLRRDIGIPDKKDFMLAFRECVEQKRVKEIRPANTMFKYGPEYRKWIVVKIKKIKEIDYIEGLER